MQRSDSPEFGQWSTRRRRWASGVAAALLVGLGGATLGCGVPVDDSATVVDAEDVPYDLLSPTTTAIESDNEQGQETSICLNLEGSVLSLGRSRAGDPPLDSLLDLATAGPTSGEASLGLRNALTGEEAVTKVTLEDGNAQVELSATFVDLPADRQLIAVAQLTCTLTSQPGVDSVAFSLDGKDVEVPLQDGSLVSRPVRRSDYSKLIAN